MSQVPETYVKIHIQTKELKTLYDLLKRYLSEQIDEQLEELGLDGNTKTRSKKGKTLREKVRKLVLNQFLDRLFNAIKYSIELDDGLLEVIDDPDTDIVTQLEEVQEDSETKVEPYDFALNDKLRNVYLQVEEKIEEVTKLRKVKPLDYYNAYEKMLLANEEWVDNKVEENKQFRDRCLSSLEKQMDAEAEDTNEEANYAVLVQDYEKFLANIALLKKEIPDTVSQLDNLINVMEFLNNLKR
ncbi:hypothetical protein FOA43_000123 [Brettanomyces nanus]|uniref:Uncharacterized protein n=1 Tax=Eeniella nana TaxID=13502 RepID=A0A875RVD9_EENNA|nr:uncharacterized protein FOA43_000123 [Brettanomyces nanus]QPG72821.1 hypothetical protein FOA43_000123 [Brettanomyces nanus]